MSAIRIAELNRLYRARYGEQLPDTPEGRDAILIAANHLMLLPGVPQKRLMDWCSTRAPWLTIREIEDILSTVAIRPQTWKADSLAWRLKLTYADREALLITTIGAIDCNKRQREARRKLKGKLRDRTRRAAQKEAARAP